MTEKIEASGPPETSDPINTSMDSHDLVAVGYDDHKAGGADRNGKVGAILFRNSWGTGWGDHGYGWLPYELVTPQLFYDAVTIDGISSFLK